MRNKEPLLQAAGRGGGGREDSWGLLDTGTQPGKRLPRVDPAQGQRRCDRVGQKPLGEKAGRGAQPEKNARKSRCSSELEIRLGGTRAAAGDSPAPARRLPTRPHAPGPGGHPAPSGRSPRTRLPVGSAGCNPRRHGDFTPPSWDPAARYRQPCTSCLKTQGRERARESPVLAEWREGRSPAGRVPEGAAGGVTSALLAMVGTGRGDPPRQRPPRAGSPGPGPPPAGRLATSPARTEPFRFQPRRGLPSPHVPKSVHYRLPPRLSVVCLRFHRFLSSPPPPLGEKTALGKV